MFQLANLRSQCEKRNIPCISPATEEFLRHELELRKPKKCIEIGSAVCYSSIVIASCIKQRGWKLQTFEISLPAYKEGSYNLTQACCTNVQTYPFNFWKITDTILGAYAPDFAFVDGRKCEYKNYVEILLRQMKKETCIIIDDVIKFANKSDALYAFCSQMQLNYTILPLDKDDGIMKIVV